MDARRLSTFCFEQQFDDLPLLSVIDKGHEIALCRLSGIYEVTATDEGDWFISTIWACGENAEQVEVKFDHPMWEAVAAAITARHAAIIDIRIGEEIADHAVPGGL